MLLSTFSGVFRFEESSTGVPSPSRAVIKDELLHFGPSTSVGASHRLKNSRRDNEVTGLTEKGARRFGGSPIQASFILSLDLSSLTMEDSSEPLSFESNPPSSSKKIGLFHVKFPVKRPSLQSLRTPTFFQTSNPSKNPIGVSRSRSPSVVAPAGDAALEDVATLPVPVVSPPLLDEDPFADLHASPPAMSSSEHSNASYNTSVELSKSFTVLLPSQASLQHRTPKRPKSSGHGQARPANTRPAFSPRPSLPSLHTLAQINTTVPRRARKGTPGARLPHEPWNMDPSNHLSPSLDPSAKPLARPLRAATVPQTPIPSNARLDFALSRGASPSSPTLEREQTDSDDSGISPCYADGRPASTLHDDAEIDSLPSLSYTASEPSSSALSRSSSIQSYTWSKTSIDQNSVPVNHSQAPGMFFADGKDGIDEDDPLSYHSDFDYYTQPHPNYTDSDSDLPSKIRYQAPSPEITPTPYTSLYSPDTSSVFGRPVHTMPSVLQGMHQHNVPLSSKLEDVPRDSNGAPEKRGSPPRRGGDEGRRDPGRKKGSFSGNNSLGGYGHGQGSGGDDGDKGRRPIMRSPALSDSDYSSSSDEGDNGTIYYSVDGTSIGHSSRPPSRTRSVRSRMISGSDDDVPLAQSMPTALRAQRSIRKQLRNERHQRRMERAKGSRPTMPSEQPPAVPTIPYTVMHSRQRSASVAPAPRSEQSHGKLEPFPVEDLAKKLATLRTATPLSAAPLSSNVAASRVPVPGFAPRVPRPQATDEMGFIQQIPPYTADKPPQERQLRSMRSFHRSEGRTVDATQPIVELSPSQRLGRRPVAPSRRTEDQPVRRDKSVTRPSRDGPESRNGSDSFLRSARASEDNRWPTPAVPRVSIDQDAGQRVPQRPIVPAAVELVQSRAPPLHTTKVVIQQRVFIGDMQRFNMVEITDNTTAGDVIALVASQGSLDQTTVWMLFELANDFGMERPIRSYELLSDVTSSWNKDKLLNAFLIKRTYLAPFLSRLNIPTSSPTNRGWVEWESKKGKWSKRWMELREHSLWMSKRDTGKDETFLCSLSNFDAYYVTRKHKSPKSFVFAIKSTDNISLFEDVSDYLHVLSCNQKDGERWMEAILVARSYVLFQERHVLFAKPGESTPNSNISTSRSRARGQSISTRPAQPLVNVSAPYGSSTTIGPIFEPGSLLAKHKGDTMS